MKKIIKVFIKEIIPIIAGILIAMYINNWNENRKNNRYINQISSSINKELTETNEGIIANIPRQKSLIDTLDFYLENKKTSLIDVILKNKGLYLPTIKMNSWKAVSNSKIELLEYEKARTLSNIEEQKNIMKMKTERLATLIYSNAEETGRNKKELMKLMIKDIIGTEMNIQEEITFYQKK